MRLLKIPQEGTSTIASHRIFGWNLLLWRGQHRAG